MLQIRLSKVPQAEGGAGAVKPLQAETVTVACPDHLILADLPVAKGIGAATAASIVKSVGRRSRRHLGERVHFCVRCDFPIAVYGRLSPCEHVFCLDCARSDSICYLCDDRIQKIQTIKLMEGIFICAAPHCLKSFLKRTEFESHIQESHADLLKPNAEKEDGNEIEALSAKQSTASESTVRGLSRPIISPSFNSQAQERDEKFHRQQSRDQPTSGMQQQDSGGHSQGFDRHGPHGRFPPQNFDVQGTPHQESSQFSEKPQGILADPPYSQYPPLQSIPPPNYVVPANSNPMLSPPLPFGFPPFPTEGAQQYYSTPYEVPRQDTAAETGSEQGSLLGFPPGAAGGMNFSATYPQPWNTGQAGVPYEHAAGGQGMPDAFANAPDSQVNHGFYQGDYRRSPGGLPVNSSVSSMANKSMDLGHSGNAMDLKNGRGILAPQPPLAQLPLPPPLPLYLSHNKRGKFHSGDTDHDGQGHGWQNDSHSRDSFGSGQD
ncbi:E3 ubiquitin-protein ligase Hakai-like [Cucurbita moschata]|uniref:RING-type E3 ubiquitin transferase n=1 Tax=Cucurbita moschata TaxID=3662 RepID=A0A6J1FAM2_CUCMO|nr:E3 ubiquitin-protein ligase Hakai-like [Cucurbita moschata]XP_022935435.1 E3 ubiquitin-protein ligase Hakai-like [Cucurbita moschata]